MTAEPTDIKVSVVATVLNEAGPVAALLEALVGQTRRPDEIIIVDGGSTDGTLDVARNFDSPDVPLRCLHLPGANIAAGRNEGVRRARGDIVACTDAGCLPDQNWLAELVRPFDDPQTSVVGGAYRIAPRSRFERVAGLLTMPGQLTPIDPPRFNPSARSLAFRVAAWRRAGGFPDWLYTAEDTLFDCKLRQIGETFVFAEDAIVRWRPRRGWMALARQFTNYARGEARIGRGQAAALFWMRRYAVTCFVLGVALACGAWTMQPVAVAAGLLAAAVLLIGPVHRRAAAVAGRSLSLFDYPLAVALSHWIALAAIRGQLLGIADRRREGGVYVEKLRAYWGDAAVGDAPPWRLKASRGVRTLIVSWYWPPANRACTNVLRNVFGHADPAAFRVLTRAGQEAGRDPLPVPPLAVHRVGGPLSDDDEYGWRNWLASIRTAVGMVRAARRVQREWPVERVLAVYPQRYGLVAGYLASRVLGVPLVAYVHDLFAETSIAKNRIKRRFWARVDAAILGAARLVVVPTPAFAAHYRRRGVRATWVLPHCRPCDVAPAPLPTGERLKLVYAGSIYQAHEDAVAVLVEAVDAAAGVDLTILAHPNRIVPGERCRWVSRAEARAAIAAAHVGIVALGRNTPYALEIAGCFPSKIVDYLAAGRPILAIVPAGCYVDRFVRATGCGVSVTSGAAADVVAALERLRDVPARERMARAARVVAAGLDGGFWMRRLAERLMLGAPPRPSRAGGRPAAEPPRAAQPAVPLDLAGAIA